MGNAALLKDFGRFGAFLVAAALSLLAYQLSRAIVGGLDFSIAGYRPLHGLVVTLENSIVSWTHSAYQESEKQMTKGLSGLVDDMAIWVGLTILFGLGVKLAFEYLWNHAIPSYVSASIAAVTKTANEALAKARDVAADLELRVSSAEHYALGRAEWALDTAKAYAERRLAETISMLRGDIQAAKAAAERYADTGIAKLGAAEDAAIAGAVGLAAAAKVAGEEAGRVALEVAERELGAGLALEAARRAAELAQLDAAGKAALELVRSVAVNVEEELHTIEGALGVAGLAALIAAIPALSTLVQSFATEAGLENAECRSKVKNVCQTDPDRWGHLLAGLVALGIAFNLEELYNVARPLVGGLAEIIEQAA